VIPFSSCYRHASLLFPSVYFCSIPLFFRSFYRLPSGDPPSASSYPLVWWQIVIWSSSFAIGLHIRSSLFWILLLSFTLMRGATWYHLPSIEAINTVREIEQVDHIMQQSGGSCGSPSGPSAIPAGSSPMISVGGAPCSCISFISDITLRPVSGSSSE